MKTTKHASEPRRKVTPRGDGQSKLRGDETDQGYGASHGYGPGHGGPSGPGDVPGDRAPGGPAGPPEGEAEDQVRPSERGPAER